MHNELIYFFQYFMILLVCFQIIYNKLWVLLTIQFPVFYEKEKQLKQLLNF